MLRKARTRNSREGGGKHHFIPAWGRPGVHFFGLKQTAVATHMKFNGFITHKITHTIMYECFLSLPLKKFLFSILSSSLSTFAYSFGCLSRAAPSFFFSVSCLPSNKCQLITP
ncbi:hypothetical protein ILYODFUR_002012 [Ilyodon furcidens]|uniref:Uncharacterized protein n=1 Tax=Ilyodon furcidens TaxID=33524 RepID=A0ABV0URV8_9TELE